MDFFLHFLRLSALLVLFPHSNLLFRAKFACFNLLFRASPFHLSPLVTLQHIQGFFDALADFFGRHLLGETLGYPFAVQDEFALDGLFLAHDLLDFFGV